MSAKQLFINLINIKAVVNAVFAYTIAVVKQWYYKINHLSELLNL